MSMTKFASFDNTQILEIKGTREKQRTASLDKISDYHDYRTNDGYMYVRIRAQSSRVNKNHDGWPSVELAGGPDAWDEISKQHQSSEGGFTVHADAKRKHGFSTFLGKPFFVDHNNHDPKRARGVVVDARLNVEDAKTAALDPYYSSDNVDPEHMPPTEIELLIEVDAKSFPKSAKALLDGDIDGFSMGCDVTHTKCSHCGNVAHSPQEYCSHIKMKGAEHDFKTADGKRTSRRSYENCYGIGYFEISEVFDPADETALTKEVVAKTADIADIPDYMPEQMGPDPHYKPSIEEVMQLAKSVMLENPGMELQEAMPLAERELTQRYNIHPRDVKGEGFNTPDVKVINTDPLPKGFPMLNTPGNPVRQGKTASEPELPQSEHTTSPAPVNTLRKEDICPVCGSDMDDGKCDVCGFVEPPDGLQNPDLEQHENLDLENQLEQSGEVSLPSEEDAEPEAPDSAKQEGTFLTTKPKAASRVISEMRWQPKYHSRVAKRVNTIEKPIKPASTVATDEPREIVTSDQSKPVTSAFRTAQEFIEAAKRNQENNMSNTNRVAAEPADPSGKPDKRVQTTGIGGVDEATNEGASKPEGPHGEAGKTVDVAGKGGVIQDSNAEASRPDETENLPTAGEKSDDSGFNKDKNQADSGPTKTWDNSNEPGSAVSDKTFAAAQGVKPNGGADVQPERREDLEREETPSPIPGTQQWTGTGGNGVTRQQDPVTRKTINTHIVAAIKLADAEVELGLIADDEKYNRIAELQGEDEQIVQARLDMVSRVRTAGLVKQQRTAAVGEQANGVGKLPSFRRAASEAPEPEPVDESTFDSALFR